MLSRFLVAATTRCFELLQTFRTTRGSAVTLFEIQNKLFAAFSNFGGYKTKLQVYVLQQNKFKLNQTINSYGALDVEYFTIHGEHFLVAAGVLYRWETGTFKEIQRIPAIAIIDIHYFTINTRKFMSVCKAGSNQVSIYEWKNQKFSNKLQNIAIKSPSRCNTFAIKDIMYIACGRAVYSSATTVLKWSENRFQPF